MCFRMFSSVKSNFTVGAVTEWLVPRLSAAAKMILLGQGFKLAIFFPGQWLTEFRNDLRLTNQRNSPTDPIRSILNDGNPFFA